MLASRNPTMYRAEAHPQLQAGLRMLTLKIPLVDPKASPYP